MKIEVIEEKGVSVLRLSGSLDSNSTPVFEDRLAEVTDAGARQILVDLGEVDFLSSVGLRAFLLTARRLGPVGGKLSVCGPNEAVRETLVVSGFNKLFKVFETRQEALANL